MLLKHNIILSVLLIFGLIISLGACSKVATNSSSSVDCTTYNYSDCITNQPQVGEMKMSFTINSVYHWVPFVIYKGTADKGEIIVRDTAWDSEVIYMMPIPAQYAVKAKYEFDGKTIYAIDGTKIKAIETQKCDSFCWSVINNKLDVELH